MGAPVNPLVGGLFNAMNIANLIQRGKRENERLNLEKQQQAQSEERQNADLSMRLSAAGARPVTPSDDLEAQIGHRIDFTNGTSKEGIPTQIPTFRESDIGGRFVKVGKERYVLPSQAERDARDTADGEKAVALEGSKAAARGKAGNDSYAARLKSTGIPVTAEMAKYAGLPIGSFIQQEHIDDVMRTVALNKKAELDAKKPAAAARTYNTVDDNGDAHLISPDGTQKIITGAGKSKTLRSGAAPRLTANQSANQQLSETASKLFADAGGDPVKAEAAAKASADPYVRKNMLGIVGAIRKTQPKTKTIANMTADEAIAEFSKVAGGADTAKTPPAATKPTKGTVSIDQIKRYAQKKKIDLKTATAEFADAGYGTP